MSEQLLNTNHSSGLQSMRCKPRVRMETESRRRFRLTCTPDGALALGLGDGGSFNVEGVASHCSPGKAHDHARGRVVCIDLVA